MLCATWAVITSIPATHVGLETPESSWGETVFGASADLEFETFDDAGELRARQDAMVPGRSALR